MGRHLWLRLVLPLCAAAAMAILVGTFWPAQGLFINVATELLGIVVTVAYVDWVLRRHETDRWRGADDRMRDNLQRAASVTCTGLRTAFGIHSDALRESEVMSGDLERGHREVLRVAIHVVAPAAEASLRRFTEKEWTRLDLQLRSIWGELDRVLNRFSHRMSPDQFEALLDAQEAAFSARTFWSTFPDVLGVPASTDKEREVRQNAARITAQAVQRLIDSARRIARSAGIVPSDA